MNFRPVLVLAALAVLAASALALAHRVQVDRTARVLLARALAAGAAGDTGLAVSYLAKYLALRPGDDPAASASRLSAYVRAHPGDAGPVAALLEDLGRLDLAESLYRGTASRPGGRLALAGFLARRGRGVEALAACEAAWADSDSDPGDVAEATLAALDALGDDPEALRRVSARLGAAVADPKAPARVVTSLAAVRETEGRHEDARGLYRRALALDEGDVVALNNLALLEALRGRGGAEALALVGRAIDRAGPDHRFLDTRGVVRLAAGDTPGAVADLKVAALGTDPGPAYFHLSRAFLGSGDPGASAGWLRKAAASRLDPRALHPLERPAYRKALADIGGG